MYNGIRPVSRSVVRVSERSEPSGVRKDDGVPAGGARADGGRNLDGDAVRPRRRDR